jgi:hypothetical protein
VLGDRWATYRNLTSELADRAGLVGQQFEDGPTSGVPECG